ncbi:MAG: hypothetical protein IPM07_23885 [Anaerolineales bacterium]|nr:hypothetical protein [Anaerolineales bacterium]
MGPASDRQRRAGRPRAGSAQARQVTCPDGGGRRNDFGQERLQGRVLREVGKLCGLTRAQDGQPGNRHLVARLPPGAEARGVGVMQRQIQRGQGLKERGHAITVGRGARQAGRGEAEAVLGGGNRRLVFGKGSGVKSRGGRLRVAVAGQRQWNNGGRVPRQRETECGRVFGAVWLRTHPLRLTGCTRLPSRQCGGSFACSVQVAAKRRDNMVCIVQRGDEMQRRKESIEQTGHGGVHVRQCRKVSGEKGDRQRFIHQQSVRQLRGHEGRRAPGEKRGAALAGGLTPGRIGLVIGVAEDGGLTGAKPCLPEHGKLFNRGQGGPRPGKAGELCPVQQAALRGEKPEGAQGNGLFVGGVGRQRRWRAQLLVDGAQRGAGKPAGVLQAQRRMADEVDKHLDKIMYDLWRAGDGRCMIGRRCKRRKSRRLRQSRCNKGAQTGRRVGRAAAGRMEQAIEEENFAH